MGIIDSFSDYSLYDVLDGSLGFDKEGGAEYATPEGSVDFYGLHIIPRNDDGQYLLQYDGHIGEIDRIDSDDFDDILELVDHLMGYVFEIEHLEHYEDEDELIEYAGKIMTEDKQKAESEPDTYIHVRGL